VQDIIFASTGYLLVYRPVMLIFVLVLVLACPVLEKSLMNHLKLKFLNVFFSQSGLNMHAHQARMTDQMLETLVFLKCNRHM